MEQVQSSSFKPVRETASLATMLVIGAGPEHIPELRRAATESALSLVHKPSVPTAAAWMERESPSAVLVHLRTLLACDLISSLRRTPRWEHVPILGLTTEPTEIAFAETFWAGGDDVVSPADVDSLVARLRVAQSRSKPEPEDARGRIVVAGGEGAFRVAAARVLSGAGYEVELAMTAEEVESAASDPTVRAIVLSASLPGMTALSAVESARAAGRRVPFVVSVAPRLMHRARTMARHLDDVALCDAFAAPDEILFATNELLSENRDERRGADRVAFGTRVWLRPAGADRDVIGYTYNISAGGLFVRTLYPFAQDQAVWMEIVPPRGGRRVRLAGRAAWHRPFGPLGPALCPPGTGFQITGGLPGEAEMFEAGVARLAADTGAS